MAIVTGHIRLVPRKRGDVYYARWRQGERQGQKKLGPAWKERSRPPAGYYTRKTADAALQAMLTDLRRGTVAAEETIGATFADGSAEWLRHAEQERDCKHSTLKDYALMVRVLDAEFGDTALEKLTARKIESWLSRRREKGASNRTAQKYLTALSGILSRAQRVWGLAHNVADDVDRPRVRPSSKIDVLSPEEVWALVRAAESQQDAAIFLTAAFSGLRLSELLALRWRCVDFERESIRVESGFTLGREGLPKSNRERAVPMAPEVLQALARLGQRANWVADHDLVFAGELGGHLSPSKLRIRYHAALTGAGLRRLRFHDLRHTFGSIAINRADPVQVKTWMGHADLKTTERYLHYKERGDEAMLLSGAFSAEPVAETVPPTVPRTAEN